MDSSSTQTQLPDPLRLDRCPECGYLLTGLPEEGICPECGWRYDATILVLWGWACGKRARSVNSRRRVGGLWQNVYFVLMLYTLSMIWFANGSAFPVMGTFLVMTAISLAIALLNRQRRRRLLEDRPAPVQLRLVPGGFGQRDGVGPVDLNRWDGRMRLYVRYRRSGSCRIRSYMWYVLVPGSTTGGEVIDFDWPCDEKAAERIRHRVEALYQAAQQRRWIHQLCRKNQLTQEEAEQQIARIRQQMQRQGFWR